MGDVLGHVKFFDQTLKLMNWLVDHQRNICITLRLTLTV